jgi:hypothetical protein
MRIDSMILTQRMDAQWCQRRAAKLVLKSYFAMHRSWGQTVIHAMHYPFPDLTTSEGRRLLETSVGFVVAIAPKQGDVNTPRPRIHML